MAQSDASFLPLSLFELVRNEIGQTVNPLRCTKATLVHLSHTLEDIVLSQQLPALLFTGFQESSHWREETERYRALAEIAQQVCIFAGGDLPPESSAKELHVTLRGNDPLRQEWFVVILSERFSVLLCGQDQHVSARDEATRQFDTLWSFEPMLVNRVLDRLEEVIASYRPERLEQLRQARSNYPPTPPDAALMTQFTSEMIRFEEHLHQALKATSTALSDQMLWRDDLLATLVHDMRTPLHGLVMTMNLLETWDPHDSAVWTQLFVTAKNSINSLYNLTQMLLDTNQLAAGKLPVMWQAMRPQEIVEEAFSAVESLIRSDQQEFDIQYDPHVQIIWGDKSLLVRVMQNLLGNAVKFTPARGHITVGITKSPQSDFIELRVRDTGTGIPSSALPSLFERYYQSERNDRRGNGLGLYFCRIAIEAHGGSIRATSQLGVGTTITITLPSSPKIA